MIVTNAKICNNDVITDVMICNNTNIITVTTGYNDES